MALPPPKPPKPGAPAAPAAGGLVRPGGGLARPGEDAMARAKREKDEIEEACQALEEELESLKARYEQYFLGVERKEPNRWREEVKKKVMRLKGAFTRNAGLKFRIQSLHARYLSYERLWLRSAREKEEGTYHRDLFKAKLRAKHDEPAPEERAPPPAPPVAARAEPQKIGAAAPVAAASAPAPAAPGKAARAPAPPPGKPRAAAAAPPKGGMSDAQLRALYDQYRAAKMNCREDVSKLTYEAVASTVSKQIPELMNRFKAKSVEFKVEVKEGRAVLKAIPKV